MTNSELIALLMSINLVCFVFLCVMAWSVFSGRFKRFIMHVNYRDLNYTMPRREVRRCLKNGGGYKFAFEAVFKALMYYDEEFRQEHGGLEVMDFVTLEKEFEGENTEQFWCAVVDVYCNREEWKRYVKKYPIYSLIEELWFGVLVKRFGGCIGRYA